MSLVNGLTKKGIALLAKNAAGAKIQFTKISMGSGFLPDTQTVDDTLSLIMPVINLDISSIKANESGTVAVRAVFNSSMIAEDFYFRELGLYAIDPDEGEILYCYENSGAVAEYIRADGASVLSEKTIDIVTLISDAANVTAYIQADGYLTRADAEEAFAPLNHASSKVDYGVANGEKYGHVKLSDDVSDDGVNSGKAATPAAVKSREPAFSKLPLSKMPTSTTANRVLRVGAANSDPVYSKIDLANDVTGNLSWDSLNDVTNGYQVHGFTVSGITVSSALGKYARAGGNIVIEGDMTFPTAAGTDAVRLSSLPLNCSSNVIIPAWIWPSDTSPELSPISAMFISLTISGSSTDTLYLYNANTGAAITGNMLSGYNRIQFCGSYAMT